MERFFVQWHFTNHCNLRCRHCYQDDFSDKEDLRLAGLLQVANHLLDAIGGWNQKACLHLTGGEPLLKPELWPLLEYLDRNPAVEDLGIITNGLLLDPPTVGRFSLFPKLTKLKISLDGPDVATNDSIRPRGTFLRVRQNLLSLKRNGRFEIILMFTVMRRNARSLLSFIEFARELEVNKLIIERFIPWGRGRSALDEVLAKDQWRDLVTSLYEFHGLALAEGEIPPYQAFQVDFEGTEPELLGAPCVLGTEGLCVMPAGTVFPCRRFPLAIGNLLNDSLKRIWEKSEILSTVRKKEKLEGKCGTCPIQECRGCRSLAYAMTGNFLAEDPHCWYSPSPSLPIIS